MSETQSRRRDKEDTPTKFTLGPLLEAKVFASGQKKLSCGVGGRDFYAGTFYHRSVFRSGLQFHEPNLKTALRADLGSNGEIIFEGQVFKSPSAFSVFGRSFPASFLFEELCCAICYDWELMLQ